MASGGLKSEKILCTILIILFLGNQVLLPLLVPPAIIYLIVEFVVVSRVDKRLQKLTCSKC